MAWKKDLINLPILTEEHKRYLEMEEQFKKEEYKKFSNIENRQEWKDIQEKPEPDLPEPKTDYTKQYNPQYRDKMLFRYQYLFHKPENEMMPIEKAMKWFLMFQGYDSMHDDDNAIEIRRKRSIENNCDAILQHYKIPISLIEDYALIEKAQDRTIKIKKNFTEEEMDVYQ